MSQGSSRSPLPTESHRQDEELTKLRRELSSVQARLEYAKRAQDELAEITARTNAVFDAAVDGILTIDEDGIVASVNAAACRLFGYGRDEIVGRNVRMLMPSPYSEEHDGYLANYRRTGERRIIGIGREVEGRRADGSTFPMELAVGEAAANGHKIFSGVVRDTTERRRIEGERASLGRILEESRNEIFVFDDRTLKFRLVNREARKNLGFSLEELQEMTPVDIKPEFTAEAFAEMVEPVRQSSGETLSFRTTHRRKDGSEYHVDIRLQHSQERREFVAIILDVTERDELERQLVQSQKMEAIGTLAGGVAHDFNNLLTSIQGSSELILATADGGSRLERSALRIKKAAERGAALTKQLLAFSRKQVTRPEVMELNDAVREVGELFGRMIGEDVAVDFDLHPDAGSIDFDPGQFDQVLVNLVVNARDAMPEGGKICVSTQPDNVDAARTRGLKNARGRVSRLSITDTGSGIRADVLAKIFDPFFTTKPIGKGTGLGLATVRGILEQHGAGISVESEVGQGTTFSIIFPRADRSAEAQAEDSSIRPSESLSVAGKILVVEDDALMRELMVEVLDAAGFAAESVEGPAKAIDRVRNEAPPDLVITDVVMPEMSGFTLAKVLAEMAPGIRVLFMSGYTDQVLADRGELSQDDPFIRKPFGNDRLIDKVHELLAQR
jgi:PAS domain S-box-containing protein